MRNKTFAQAVNEAHHVVMNSDPSVICFGLGVTDPKAIFGTTKGLVEAFGPARVFDVPTSEAALTGVATGAALGGLRPIMTHQRLDFFLLAMDQLVNAAAKWHYMFGSQTPIPLTIRLIVGRGWGQGPTHSQNLHAWFAHLPGLKVVMPSNPQDAKGLFISAVRDNNPVLFIEHRWLHESEGVVQEGDYETPLGLGSLLSEGSDVTIVATSIMTTEAVRAVDFLLSRGIGCDLIDLRSVRPIDWAMIVKSARKTGRLVVADSGSSTGSFADTVISAVVSNSSIVLKNRPAKVAMPDVPEPTSFGLTRGFHVGAKEIATAVLRACQVDEAELSQLDRPEPHDVPGNWFKGPF
jgi:pyruvate dehydrogenase E1 component beta subunit